MEADEQHRAELVDARTAAHLANRTLAFPVEDMASAHARTAFTHVEASDFA